MGAGFGRIWAGTGGAAAGSSSTAGPASAAAESKPRRRHFILGGHASRYPFNKIADVMGANDNNCEDFYDLEAKKLDGTTVRSFKYTLRNSPHWITKPSKNFNTFKFSSCFSLSSASCWARWC